MSRTYKVTGINLKSMPLGEADRLLTILTPELGLIRAVAPGARKHQSKLAGRSGLFVVNELLIAKGRTLDKITQADTLESYPGLSQDLQKLTASQYLAELVLCQALSDQPQAELYELLNEHLHRLEQLSDNRWVMVLAHLVHGVFHQLALGGIAPQVQFCCITQHPIVPDFTDPDWRVGFSAAAGGTVTLKALQHLEAEARSFRSQPQLRAMSAVAMGSKQKPSRSAENSQDIAAEGNSNYHQVFHPEAPLKLNTQLNAIELSLLQQLAGAKLLPRRTVEAGSVNPVNNTGSDSAEHPLSDATLRSAEFNPPAEDQAWVCVEQILRQYIQYHFGRSIRSAALMDACFSSQLSFS